MKSDSDRTPLRPYAPAGLLTAGTGAAPKVARQTRTGAVLVADLCGFTAQTEELERLGRAGAEELSDLLDRTFGPFVDQICACGGDVVAFAGDSVLAVWEEASDAPTRESAVTATRCALDLLAKHRSRSATDPLYLPMRISLGTGEVCRFELGGVGDRWVHMAAGEAVEEALRGDALHMRDRVVLPDALARRMEPELIGEWVDDGHFAALRLASDATQRVEASSPTPDEASSPMPDEASSPMPDEASSPMPNLASASLLKNFVPEAVVQRLAAGPSEFVAEFRNVTAVFLGFNPDLVGDLERLQEVTKTAQQTLNRFDGVLYQMIKDDKGLTLIGAFGLPPHGHEDDPERAVEFARQLVGRFDQMGVPTRVALSSGSVYCGDYGGTTRRQYGVVGQSMNRAAHLLSATSAGMVTCDENTRQRASTRRDFVALPPHQIAGMSEPVNRYLAGVAWSDTPRDGAPELVGRSPLRRRLADYLDQISDDRQGPPMLVLEGEAGIGKTTLLSDLLRRAEAAGIRVVWSQGETTQPAMFSALRPLLRMLRDVAPDFESALRRIGRAGPLQMVLPDQFEEDPSTEALTPQLRVERLIEVLRGWCTESAAKTPVLWLLEDAHWIDSASQAVAAELVGSIPRFGVVLGQRPFPMTGHALRHAPREVLSMQPLSEAETERVLAARLGVDAVPDALVESIQRRAAGNPLFAEEIAGVLVAQGDLLIEDGVCRVHTSLRNVEHSSVPPSVEGAITTRVDRLDVADQLTLKAASVLGRTFDEALLAQVRPDAEAEALTAQLAGLVAAGFITAGSAAGSFAFRHPLFQEVTYSALVRSQREALHRRAAEALEAQGVAGTPEPELARLAIHWEQSGDLLRAFPLLSEAANQALRAYANEESIDLHERALAARATLPSLQMVDTQRARIEWNIANAHANLARHEQARDHFQVSLGACGMPEPDGGLGLVPEVAVHLWHRVRRVITGRGAARISESRREAALQAMYTMADLAAADRWLGDDLAYAHVTLQLSNVGDWLEPSLESSASMSSLGYLLGLTPLRALGEADMRRGLDRFDPDGDRSIYAICQVMYGMFLTANGRPAEAIDVLAPASEASASLEGGPWRHRSRFMLAEAFLMSGDLYAARQRFAEAADLSRLGEPQVVGFANAMGALACLHLGQEREALSLLLGEDGIDGTRRNESKLPLFASLGALAEVSALCGVESEVGAAAAREAESLASDRADTATYFAGYFGHAGVVEWWLDALERGDPGAAAHVDLGLRRLRRFARRYPGAGPRRRLFEARRAWTRGRRGSARRSLARALEGAQHFGLGRERAEAELRLESLRSGEMPKAREIHQLQIQRIAKQSS